MGLIMKKKYSEEKSRIQREELESKRYELILDFLANNYSYRKNKNIETQLFQLLNSCNFNNIDFNITDEFKEKVRQKKHNDLNKMLDSLTEEQIKSNVYLKKAKLYMDTSYDECKKIIQELKNNSFDYSKIWKMDIPSHIGELIPSYIELQVDVNNRKINRNRVLKVDILDWYHIQNYEEYNDYVSKTEELFCCIYLLQLNNLFDKESIDLMCDKFSINNNKYNIILNIKQKRYKIKKRIK